MLLALFRIDCYVYNLTDQDEKEKVLQKSIDEELYNCKDIKLNESNLYVHL